MTIGFELPREIARELSTSGAELSREVRELYLVELYQQDRITHHQLAEALGLGRIESDAVLERYKVPSGPATVEELESQVALLRDARP